MRNIKVHEVFFFCFVFHLQARLAELETPKKMEHLHKLEELKKRLVELEKQVSPSVLVFVLFFLFFFIRYPPI